MGLLEKIDIISPHAFKLFAECPAKFYYRYCEQISAVTLDKSFQTGKNIHSMASYFLKGQNIKKFESALSDKEKELWSGLKENKYFSYEIVGVEKSISCRTGMFWIGGRLDALVRNGNDYYILDYKTGGVSDDMTYDYQTMVYLTACDMLLDDYNSLSFVYLDLKNKKEVVVDYTSDLRVEYTEKLQKAAERIDNFNIETFGKCNFTNCEYLKICKPNL
ncbi:MAG: PD-(D/E)XK nuclease family protein [Cyanobacteria bacterium RUI128]|nr:PD-(D/E)XK nuclease family protein [Cyanobacteria bacterium RUI128]